ncbi:SH3 domain-containing protein [Nocardioides sp. zg-536]|uniref:SH3 domain-containing protein n=1 Tax=Nocardioides faecalis TaxID=2803858 RepID=A0A938Y174_9ACTN|nr:SH3 domain-containing protein [Nocardioides faecalis]MBM9460277.1 SH3 domain-containing protein [Nocardioides faecalis]QVI59883.1 SH3 domain-containing protein [Nocardioides faecalis]
MATSHKRETARRTPRAAALAGSLAALATGAVVAGGVLTSSPESDTSVVAVDRTATKPTAVAGSVSGAVRKMPTLSRKATRTKEKPAKKAEPVKVKVSAVDRLLAKKAVAAAVKNADERRWTTEDLNLWTRPDAKAKKVGVIDAGEKVLITGRSYGERVEIVLDGAARWVTEGYLSDEKPVKKPALGASCTNGTSVASGVSANVKKVHEAVCGNFPEISTYGTFRGDGEHSQGLAVDIMVSGERGWEVAEFVRANHQALGVNYLIYAQKIWSVERAGEGWRPMSDRGSATANHYDHVHVTTY